MVHTYHNKMITYSTFYIPTIANTYVANLVAIKIVSYARFVEDVIGTYYIGPYSISPPLSHPTSNHNTQYIRP
jgi:hypothetical protein